MAVAEIAEVLKRYGVLNVTGDRFAAEWPIAEFREHGIAYEQCENNKSELYLAFVPVTNSGSVELPDDKRLFNQLRRLERKRGRAGKDSIDHPPRLHDDLANAVAGVSQLLNKAESTRREFNPSLHISPQRLRFAHGNWPIFCGLSHGDGFVATVIAQAYNAEVRVHAAFCTEGMSLRRHLEQQTKSWLVANARPLPLFGAYEEIANEALRTETFQAAREILNGQWLSISRPWEARRHSMLDTLTKAVPFTFRPAVQISPTDTIQLTQALNGRYEKPEKKNYHVVNSFSLLIARLELWKSTPKPHVPRPPLSWMSA